MINDILQESGAALAYGAVGIGLMALGYLVVEVTTPGNLGQQIWTDRNRGAALVLAAKLLGVGIIVTTAILSSEDDLGAGLLSTMTYGVLGIVLMTVAFYMLDLLTPGKLGATVVDARELHPSCWVVGAADLGTAAIVAAAIS
ncbi:hypothetical protein GCM10023085_26900 [Actinomadura viridis]|uniref:Uncharacterized membrane protein YjfL (UPF0719 family) n=1 Tax=Actinomadura viridis TaxID=58110 RepID=A0A931DIG2_9ACTN|nr:DUF350 domain-containing protein [Actinomadura viridis]MBG6087323.1 uncharacterized membrane protein YjfL (UPF0719 family) [Actinomadura viridis]